MSETASQGPDHAPILVGSFNNILTDFRENLRRHAAEVALSEESEPRVTQALQWLITIQDEEGFWGYESPGGTALCALALSSWLGPVHAREHLASTTAWLSRRWEDETLETPWDTAVAGQVLCLLSNQQNKVIRGVRERLLEYDHEDDWSTRPHHAAEILNALAVMGSNVQLLDAWSDKLKTLLQNNEYVSSVRGQVVYALLKHGGASPNRLEDSINQLVQYLEKTPMSNSEFFNHVHSLRALVVTAGNEKVVGITLDKMFSDAHRQDGSWYHDPFMTAWALLALYEAKVVRRIVVELPTFNAIVGQCLREAKALEGEAQALEARERKEQRLSISVAAVLGLCVGMLVGAVIFYRGESWIVTTVLATILFAVIASSFKFVRKRIF